MTLNDTLTDLAGESSGSAPAWLPLQSTFRYVHEPLPPNEFCIPRVGDGPRLATSLSQRLLHSTGGAVLVTGFRGAGKSTVVGQALHHLALAGDATLVPVQVSVAKTISPSALLFEIVRRLFEALIDCGVLQRLSSEVSQQLVLAYMRTSVSFKESRSRETERRSEIKLGFDPKQSNNSAAIAIAQLLPKLTAGKKTTSTIATEAAFLAYSEADAEHDFMRIVSLLGEQPQPRPSRVRRLLVRLRLCRPREAVKLRLVIVLDELDKLTAQPSGQEALEEILAAMKNLLSIRGVHYVFVGGPDLFDRWMTDVSRGNSIFESVFSWHLYVPCTWNASRAFLRGVCTQYDEAADTTDDLNRYLEFKSRGLPRRLLQEFNSLVRWTKDGPSIPLLEEERLHVFAELQAVLSSLFEKQLSNNPRQLLIDIDRWRLGIYYATDRILRTNGQTFAVVDIVGDDVAFDSSLKVSRRSVDRLIEHLVHSAFLESVNGATHQAIIEDVPLAQAPLFRIAKYARRELKRIARANARERAEQGAWREDATANPVAFAGAASFRARNGVIGGRYEIGALIGRGGMGSVYRCRDTVLGKDVAVKMLEPRLLQTPEARARFAREGRIARGMVHPHIVRTLETIESESTLAIVMEYIDGKELSAPLKQHALPPARAIAITSRVLSAVAYIHDRQIVRLDLKPSNIVLRAAPQSALAEDDPVIIDFGIAKPARSEFVRGGFATSASASSPDPDEFVTSEIAKPSHKLAMVGTPKYMAPEQLAGNGCDHRSDIFSMGLLIYEMITGNLGSREDALQLGYPKALQALASRKNPWELAAGLVSEELRAIVARATAFEPEQRFSNARAMLEAIKGTPEARATRPLILSSGRTLVFDRPPEPIFENGSTNASNGVAAASLDPQGGAASMESDGALLDLGKGLTLRMPAPTPSAPEEGSSINPVA